MLRTGFLCVSLLALTGALLCPDGQSCDDGSACCLGDSGEYGCCPRSLPVVHAHFWEDEVICPDLSGCPAEYSCLKSTYAYQCCPHSQGVLCSDGMHCCPEHHRCAEDGQSCIREKAEPVGAVVCPDGESECPDGSTCCQLPDGTWGCCPMAKAVCCEDRKHCCPAGSVCDPHHSQCHSPHGDTPMLPKGPARRRAVGKDQTAAQVYRDSSEVKDGPMGRETAVICPDGRQCPDATTCCQLTNGTYGCCPFENAVCCSDHLHCCPAGTICDLEHLTCESASSSTPLVKTTAARNDVDCPDRRTRCPEDSTCCALANGTYGCCGFKNAVCCDDHIHCCPEGTTCDVAAGSCDDGVSSVPWLEKLPSLPRRSNKAQDVQCDSLYACPDGSTCCKTEEGTWACCPLPEAVCCDDHIHCCPKDTTCDVAAGSCDEGVSSVPWLEKLPSLPRRPNKAGDVSCDSWHDCPDDTTCCKTDVGEWSCCPLPEAVCCDDHIHCCPKGTTCNEAAGTCDDGVSSVPWLEKLPSLPRRSNKAQNVLCDSQYACPDGNTCCKTEEGTWSCCPLPEAVCCDDHIHCCPKDTICDVAAGSCDDGVSSVPWLEKLPSLPLRSNKAQDVQCDSQYACPDGSTCCKTEEGTWGCCPLPQAVCCDDHIHCCPDGTICDVAAGSCDDGVSSMPWLEKLPSLPRRSIKAQNVLCDSQYACPDGSTCCKTEEGTWACCPLPQAVCCDDHIHCCPEGTTCDVAAGSCDDAMRSVPWLEKLPSLPLRPNKVQNVQCDSQYACPDGNTCCKTGGVLQIWSCCPLPEAVCCDDHFHCCPKDTTCDVAAGSCDDGVSSVPWLEKLPSLPLRPNKMGDVSCDPSFSCPDGTTCCRIEGGDWACCPLPKAVCCDDLLHCCPKGTTCNVSAGTCDDVTGSSSPWLKKVPALSRTLLGAKIGAPLLGNVPCDRTTSCPDDNTCCFMKHLGKWGCCPLPKAVCCEDGDHCCPFGYTCTELGRCTKGRRTIPWFTKTAAVTRPALGGDVKCDPETSCPSFATCCPLPNQRWGCCPLTKAVCCEDMKHCCPTGYTCDPRTGSCHRSGVMRWDSWQNSSILRKRRPLNRL